MYERIMGRDRPGLRGVLLDIAGTLTSYRLLRFHTIARTVILHVSSRRTLTRSIALHLA